MKLEWITLAVVLTVGLGCRPEVGAPISKIAGPAILAVKGVPAEVDPHANNPVAYEALAVDLDGRVPAPDKDITEPLLWALCDQPKPPTESNSVSSSCADSYANPGVAGTTPTTYSAPVAYDACARFGPEVPPPTKEGQPSIRPRDADITGGYYQPVRVELVVPEELRRPEMSTADSLIGFRMQRIYCGLLNADIKGIVEYQRDYQLNNNPVLTSLTVQAPGAGALDVPASAAAAAPIPVSVGESITLAANWSAESVESYPAQDPITRVLVTHFESMRVSWFATGGSFQHDITGRGENEHDTTYAENSWKSDTPGLVHLWVVLNDARGGTDFAALDLEVDR